MLKCELAPAPHGLQNSTIALLELTINSLACLCSPEHEPIKADRFYFPGQKAELSLGRPDPSLTVTIETLTIRRRILINVGIAIQLKAFVQVNLINCRSGVSLTFSAA